MSEIHSSNLDNNEYKDKTAQFKENFDKKNPETLWKAVEDNPKTDEIIEKWTAILNGPENNEKEKSIIEKLAEILQKVTIFQWDKESLNMEHNNRVYQNINDHNPEIDTWVDHSKELQEILKDHKKTAIKWWLSENQIKPSDEAETKKILWIINEVYNKDKEAIDEKLWITDINHLTPTQATKLAALVTMTKLDYNHSQFIDPDNASEYFDGMQENDKNQFRKEYYSSEVWKELLNFKMFHVDNWVTINYEYLYTELIKDKDLSKKNLDEIKIIAKEDAKTIVEKELWREINKNDLKDNLADYTEFIYDQFTKNSKIREEWVKIDQKSVSEMLDWWKWICRNYAIANEKIFEALKTIQNPNNNQLQNSILPYYSWSTTWKEIDEKNIWNIIAGEEESTKQHAWNELITIWKDWKKYVSQIDSTHADTWWYEWWKWEKNNELNKVDTIDRTFDRLLNDVVDNNKDWLKTKEILPKLEKLLQDMEVSWDIKWISVMRVKLYDFYEKIWDEEWIKKIEYKFKNSDFNIDDGRLKICKKILNNGNENKYDDVIELLWKNALENDWWILAISMINFFKENSITWSSFDETFKNFNHFFDKNPDFLKMDKQWREAFIINKNPEFSKQINEILSSLEEVFPDKFKR